MNNVIDTVVATVVTVLVMGLALLLNPLTIAVVFFVNPALAGGLLVLSLVCGLLGTMTGVFAGVIAKWKS